MQVTHNRRPDRRGAADAADAVHRFAARIPDPDADGVTPAPANRPVIAHVLAGAGFHRTPERRAQQAVGAEGRDAGVVVGKQLSDDKGRFRHVCRYFLGGRLPGCVRCRRGSFTAGFFRRRDRHSLDSAVTSAIGERTVSVGHVQQTDFRAAQSKAVAVIIAGVRQHDTQPPKLPGEGIDADHADGAHGRNVERSSQRLAYRDPAAKVTVVILRDVKAA